MEYFDKGRYELSVHKIKAPNGTDHDGLYNRKEEGIGFWLCIGEYRYLHMKKSSLVLLKHGNSEIAQREI